MISDTQKQYQVTANKHQSPAPDIKIGNKVFVKAEHFYTTRPSKKLSEKYLGPYNIIAQASTHSFTLWLPNSLWSFHPVFHISILEPSTPNTIPNCIQPPPPPVNVNGKPEHEISKILNSKLDQQYKCKLQYLIKWAGYKGTEEESSWLSVTELKHASEAVSNFH